MVHFQTKNPNLGKFGRALDGKMLSYFMAILNILCSFGTFFGVLVSCSKKNLATLVPGPAGPLYSNEKHSNRVLWQLLNRVARFFGTTGKIYQITIKCTKWR
jgi:hypothetical protein